MKGIYLSSKSRSKTAMKEIATGNNITVTFDDGSERTFTGIARMRPEQVGKQLPDSSNGIAVALVPKGDRIDDLDEVFSNLSELYKAAFNRMADTGGQLLDWSREEGLITDDERDNYYLLGGI